MKRRDFLKISSLAPLTGMLPNILSANTQAALTNNGKKAVVLIELRGGNDSLNTLIPYADEEYYKLRPKIGIQPNDLVKLNSEMGMHPSLRPLEQYWKTGQLAWIQGLGYANPSRSHFRSRDIWTTAQNEKSYKEGWVSQVFSGYSGITGISIGEKLGPFDGANTRSLRIASPEDFLRRSERMQHTTIQSDNSALNHILKTEDEILQSANDIRGRLSQSQNLAAHFPNNGLGKKLSSVARLIISDAGVPTYKVGIDGFDTHAKQRGKHKGLLEMLANNLDTFARTLQQAGKWQDVIVITYSEFGRKAQENSSQGTDHGLASSHLVMGGSVNGGKIYGDAPSLTNLDNGSAQHTMDFRSVYNTLAKNWWDKSSPWNHTAIPFV